MQTNLLNTLEGLSLTCHFIAQNAHFRTATDDANTHIVTLEFTHSTIQNWRHDLTQDLDTTYKQIEAENTKILNALQDYMKSRGNEYSKIQVTDTKRQIFLIQDTSCQDIILVHFTDSGIHIIHTFQN